MKRMTTSKLILLVDFTVALVLTALVVIGSFIDIDTYQITTVAVGWDAQLAVASGFYYWKSKNENRSIHAMQLVKELADKYGLEDTVNLANVILKD